MWSSHAFRCISGGCSRTVSVLLGPVPDLLHSGQYQELWKWIPDAGSFLLSLWSDVPVPRRYVSVFRNGRNIFWHFPVQSVSDRAVFLPFHRCNSSLRKVPCFQVLLHIHTCLKVLRKCGIYRVFPCPLTVFSEDRIFYGCDQVPFGRYGEDRKISGGCVWSYSFPHNTFPGLLTSYRKFPCACPDTG